MRRSDKDVSLLKEDILDVAIKMFATKGYSAASTQDIANALDTTRTPIYHHFKNKKILYETAVKRYLSNKVELYTKIDTQDAPFFDILHEHIEQAVDGDVNETILFSKLESDEFKSLSTLRHETGKYIRSLKRMLIIRAVENNEIRPDIDVEDVIDFIYVVFFGVSHLTTKPSGDVINADSAGLVDSCVRILRKAIGTSL